MTSIQLAGIIITLAGIGAFFFSRRLKYSQSNLKKIIEYIILVFIVFGTTIIFKGSR